MKIPMVATVISAISTVLVFFAASTSWAQGVSIEALSKLTDKQLQVGRDICTAKPELAKAVNAALKEAGISVGDQPLHLFSITLSPDENKFTENSCCQCCTNGNYCCGPCDDNCCNYSVATKAVPCCGQSAVNVNVLDKFTKEQLAACKMIGEKKSEIVKSINKAIADSKITTADGKPLYVRAYRLSPDKNAFTSDSSCCQCCVNGNYCCGPCDDNCCNYN